jgi:hypothetical protein
MRCGHEGDESRDSHRCLPFRRNALDF